MRSAPGSHVLTITSKEWSRLRWPRLRQMPPDHPLKVALWLRISTRSGSIRNGPRSEQLSAVFVDLPSTWSSHFASATVFGPSPQGAVNAKCGDTACREPKEAPGGVIDEQPCEYPPKLSSSVQVWSCQ